MSSAQMFELCKVCGKPTKMRIDFLGKVEIVDVACECERNEQLKKEIQHFRERPIQLSDVLKGKMTPISVLNAKDMKVCQKCKTRLKTKFWRYFESSTEKEMYNELT